LNVLGLAWLVDSRMFQYSERSRTGCVMIVCGGTNDTYFPTMLIPGKIADMTASVKYVHKPQSDIWLQESLPLGTPNHVGLPTPDTARGEALASTFSSRTWYIVEILVPGCDHPQADSHHTQPQSARSNKLCLASRRWGGHLSPTISSCTENLRLRRKIACAL